MTAAWPGTINQTVNMDGYSEAPEQNKITFQPEVGPPTERRRSSVSSNILAFTQFYTTTEYDDLITFYRTTLLDGVLTFTRTHPRTGLSATFKFTDVPKIVSLANGLTFVVSHSLRVLP